ncbi:MAG: glycosyltransferase [Pseudomonadota bacterium]
MEWIAALLLAGHYVVLGVLCLFGAHRFYITALAQRRYRQPSPLARLQTLPTVTVQLPLFNERAVARRVIDAAAALDYPADRLQIQVLDDSTDDTSHIVAEGVAHHAARGVRIEHLRRSDRVGFKAGALAAALQRASGEYVAVFDADFLPEKELLRSMIQHFADPRVGMVQAQWDYLNRRDSLLTRLQGMLLDAHFTVEQTGRSAGDRFFNFNGTAGIWRRAAIIDAGGWQADTITEDLDLSYRAQLARWRFVYLRDVRCMSELPSDMNAFKSQQRRWSKGGIEVMRKLLPRLWRTPIAPAQRLEGTVHLTSNLSHLLILLDGLFFLIPAVMLRQSIIPFPPVWVDLVLFTFGGLSHVYFYLGAQASLGRSVLAQAWQVPLLMATSIGLSRNNGVGVLEALLGRRTAFVRTPKQGAKARPDYFVAVSRVGEALEVAVGLIYVWATLWCVQQQVYMAVPFMAMFAFGFLYTGVSSIVAQLERRRPRAVVALT